MVCMSDNILLLLRLFSLLTVIPSALSVPFHYTGRDLQMGGCWCCWVHVGNFCCRQSPCSYCIGRRAVVPHCRRDIPVAGGSCCHFEALFFHHYCRYKLKLNGFPVSFCEDMKISLTPSFSLFFFVSMFSPSIQEAFFFFLLAFCDSSNFKVNNLAAPGPCRVWYRIGCAVLLYNLFGSFFHPILATMCLSWTQTFTVSFSFQHHAWKYKVYSVTTHKSLEE